MSNSSYPLLHCPSCKHDISNDEVGIKHAYTEGIPYPCPSCKTNLSIELDIDYDYETDIEIEIYYAELLQPEPPTIRSPFQLLNVTADEIKQSYGHTVEISSKIGGVSRPIQTTVKLDIKALNAASLIQISLENHYPINQQWVDDYNNALK